MPTWIRDAHGNRCSVEYWGSKEAAQKALDSLINCKSCVNCSYCEACLRCSESFVCTYCARCKGCTYCLDCEHCTGCKRCFDCGYCLDCVKTKHVVGLQSAFNIVDPKGPQGLIVGLGAIN
jgi:hypothetical protein